VYSLWHPTATCTIVTPRFHRILADMDETVAPHFNEMYPQAYNLAYLFVGGLFTQHYPGYFLHNISYLQDKLSLDSVEQVPIHTERSVASNALVIRDAVVAAAASRGARSVVCISHSKGGVDVCSAIARYPEIRGLLHGVVSFQAPFTGTWLVDYVIRIQLVKNTLLQVIKSVWGGEHDSFTDMGYPSRLKNILSRGAVDDTGGATSTSTSNDLVLDDENIAKVLRVYKEVPIVSVTSCASYSVTKLRSLSNAAGFASMAPMSLKFTNCTGFLNDGLVAPVDARIPYSDVCYSTEMQHTEPALYVPGTKYHPGKMTAATLVLLFEKIAREKIVISPTKDSAPPGGA
jgi:hypothetical protein